MLIEFNHEEYYLDNMPSFEINDLLGEMRKELEVCHRNEVARLGRDIRKVEAFLWDISQYQPND